MDFHATSLLRGAASVGTTAGIARSRTVEMRYLGRGFEITVPLPEGPVSAAPSTELSKELQRRFIREYTAVFGRALPEGTPEVTDWRLASAVPTALPSLTDISSDRRANPGSDDSSADDGARRGERSVRIPGVGICEADV
jgi:N-methylhydantoinase A